MFRGISRQLIKRSAPVAALAVAASVSGCAYVTSWDEDVEGVAFSEVDVSGDAPSKIALAGPDTLVISEGDSLEITLDGSEAAGEALRFDRDGNSLTIARDRKIYDGSGRAIVRMTVPAPEELIIAGGGTIEAASIAERAELVVGGSGEMTIESISAESLEVTIGGSGEVKGAGSVERLEVAIGGSGEVDLSGLKANTAEISIGGSGDVAFASDGDVTANIGGSGDIRVSGDAKCKLNSMGSGTLTCTPAEQPEETAAD